MLEIQHKSYRDYSIGEWLLLALAACAGYLLSATLPKGLHLAGLLSFSGHREKSWMNNTWTGLALIPSCFVALPATAVMSFIIIGCLGWNSIAALIYIWFGLFSIYLLGMVAVMYCERLQISPKELLSFPPKKIIETLSHAKEQTEYVESTLKLDYKYTEAFQLALASLGELKIFQVKSIDENLGQIFAVSGYKSLNNSPIIMQLKKLSDEETFLSVKVNSLNGLDSPIIPILAYLNEFNTYRH